ncbi:MAG TPA: hypothetical protein PL106_15460, partial [Flavobacteriales bacterium]|nr:hypothetical protein [Flavobacteriales bacterium]
IDTLRKGQYAFAKGNVIIGMEETDSRPLDLGIVPDPADDHIRVRGRYEGAATLFFDVLDMDGGLVQRTTVAVANTFDRNVPVATLPAGSYLLRAHDGKGGLIGTGRFSVMH